MVNAIVATIVPLLIITVLLMVLGVVAWVAYQIATDVADKTSKKMESKNMSLSKDGLKVGVKGKSAEEVGDRTQKGIMKAWNASEWPAYESKLGWGQSNSARSPSASNAEPRKAYSRHSSAQT